MTRKLHWMVDLRRLRALRALADHGTLAAAADALHLTPSAISQQLAALEREAGHRLLEPAGRSVRLTPAAAVLLRHADAVFAQLERLDGDLAAQAAGAAAGEVRVAGFPTALIGLVAPAAARLADTAPRVHIAVTEAETDEAVLLLGRRDVDVMVGMECSAAPQPGDGRFHREPLLADVLDAALPADHRLAGGRPVRLAELAGEGFVAPPVGWSCDEVLSVACRRGAEAAPAVRALFDALHAEAGEATAVPVAA